MASPLARSGNPQTPHGGTSTHGGPIEAQQYTVAELNHAEQLAQAWCERMASLLRGIARNAGHEFPELATDFQTLAQDATDLLRKWKDMIGGRQSETERQLSTE